MPDWQPNLLEQESNLFIPLNTSKMIFLILFFYLPNSVLLLSLRVYLIFLKVQFLLKSALLYLDVIRLLRRNSSLPSPSISALLCYALLSLSLSPPLIYLPPLPSLSLSLPLPPLVSPWRTLSSTLSTLTLISLSLPFHH